MQIKRISSIGHFRVTVHISEATALVERPLAEGDDRVGDGDAPQAANTHERFITDALDQGLIKLDLP